MESSINRKNVKLWVLGNFFTMDESTAECIDPNINNGEELLRINVVERNEAYGRSYQEKIMFRLNKNIL